MLLSFLGISAFLTSVLSGVIGMAGGVTLFALMTFFMPLESIIPVHGVVQLFSNFSRSYFLKKNINWTVIKFFSWGLLPGVFLALVIRKEAYNPAYIYLFISLLIFYTLIKDRISHKKFHIKFKNYFWVGLLVGCLSILAGTVGPLLAVFFQREDFSKEEIVATKAATQMLTHLMKIPTFLYLSFSYWEYKYIIVIMIIAAIAGTQLGVRILHKINKRVFFFLFRSALLIAALRLLYNSIQGI